MPSVVRLSGVRCRPALVALLLTLQVGSLCSAVQTNSSSLSEVLTRPADILGHAVQSAFLTLSSELDNRLDAVQTELDTVQTRLDTVQTQLDSRLGQLSSRVDAVQSAAGSCSRHQLPRDCSDLPAGAESGVHLLQPGLDPSQPPVAAYCDLEAHGGGWTVFQRRADVTPRQDFFLGWQAYKEGFGELDAEFWWGLEHLWVMTSSRDRQYELRFDLADFQGGERYAVYRGFRVSSEAEGYRLRAVNYSGDAGDSFSAHSGKRFSTVDRDQDATDKHHCARNHKAGWWFAGCHASNLNGPYLAGQHDSYADGVNWHSWKGYHYSLKTVTMKIRPTKKLL